MVDSVYNYSVEKLDQEELKDQLDELEMERKKTSLLLLMLITVIHWRNMLLIVSAKSREGKKKSKGRKRDLQRDEYVKTLTND